MRLPPLLLGALAAASCASASAGSPAGDDGARFERMKSLAGTWVSHGQTDAPDGATVVYRVTAAGSAVLETIFDGTPHEMVTLYTLDRGRLVLTHYCALGNQPRMERVASADENTFAFECSSLGNGDPSSDAHMHRGELTMLDANRMKSAWTLWKDGRPGETVHFTLERSN